MQGSLVVHSRQLDSELKLHGHFEHVVYNIPSRLVDGFQHKSITGCIRWTSYLATAMLHSAFR